MSEVGPVSPVPVDDERDRQGALGRTSLVIAVSTMVSRVTGLGRMVVVAAILGPTFFGNLFEAANFIPNIVFTLLAGPLLVSFVVPYLVRRLTEAGVKRAVDLGQSLMGLVVVVFGAISIVVALAAPLVLYLFTIGVADPEIAERQRSLGALLLVMVAPQILLYGIAGLGAAAQNSRRRFALAAAAPAFENVGVILTMVLFAAQYGTGKALPEVTDAEMVFLGLGSTVAVGIHCLAQVYGAARCGIVLRPRLRFQDPAVRDLIRKSRSVMGTASLRGLRNFAMMAVAGVIPGGVVALRMGLNFYNLPLALAGRSVAAASQPELTRLADGDDRDRLRRYWYRSLRLPLFVAIPAGVAFVALADPIASASAYGEMATDTGVELLALAIATLGLAVVGSTVEQVAVSAAYALGDQRSALQAAILRTLVTAIGVVVGLSLVEGTTVLVVIGLSYSFGEAMGAWWVYAKVSQRLEGSAAPLRSPLIATTVATLAMTGVSLAAYQGLALLGSGRLADLVNLGLAIGAGLAVYVLVQRRFDSEELYELAPILRPKRPDARPGPGYAAGDVGAHGRPATDTNSAVMAVITVTAVVAALLGVMSPLYAVVLVAVVGIVLTVYLHPPAAAYLYLGLTPLIVGLERGGAVPLLRPSEALMALLLGALVLRRLVRLAQGEPIRLKLGPLHPPLLVMAVAASVFPLLWMTAQGARPDLDDILFSVVLWKLFALFLLFRAAVRTAEQVRRCLTIVIAAHVVVGLVAILQALRLFGVPEMLASLFPETTRDHSNGRGSSLFNSSHAVADAMIICLGLVLAMIRRRPRTRLLVGLGIFFFVAALSSGQVSALIGVAIGLAVAGALTGQLAHVTRTGVLAAVAAAFVLQQTISRRVAAIDQAVGLPSSWVTRLENLRENFWPELFEGWNFVFGVRPSARVAAPEAWRDWIWIESGHTWLLWTGGIPLFIAFFWFLWRAATRLAGPARRDPGSIGEAAVGAVTGIWVVAFLMIFDAHLTMRGISDLLFPLLAMASLGLATKVRPPPSPSLAQPAGRPPLARRDVALPVEVS